MLLSFRKRFTIRKIFFSWQSCTIDYLEEILSAFSPACGPGAHTRKKCFALHILIRHSGLLTAATHKLKGNYKKAYSQV